MEGVKGREGVGVPVGDKQQPMGDEQTKQFGIAFDLLADGVGGTGVEQATMRLPEFEEEFNRPAGADQKLGIGKRQIG